MQLNVPRDVSGGMGLDDERLSSALGDADLDAGRFAAAGSLLGFQYQIWYALLHLLRAPPGAEMTIEKTDDITLEQDDDTGEWIQTKHHKRPTTLGDTSRDLWKTLRNWFLHMRRGSLDPSYQTLILVTTSRIRDGAAASMLRPKKSGKRNVEKALDILAQTAAKNTPASNRDYYAEFAKFDKKDQLKLLDSVIILGSEPGLEEIRISVKKALRFVAPQVWMDALLERLEGWWFGHVITSILSGTPIRFADLEIKIEDIQQQLGRRNLTLDFADATLPPDELSTTRTFVKQLEIIGVSTERQGDARLDYYKAFNQRSKWVSDDLVMITELEDYNKRLTGQWHDLFHRMKEDLEGCDDEKMLSRSGRNHYNATIDKDVRIRPDVSDPYVMRGSLHMLADDLKIGWHPNYDTMIAPPPPEGTSDGNEME